MANTKKPGYKITGKSVTSVPTLNEDRVDDLLESSCERWKKPSNKAPAVRPRSKSKQ